MDLQKKLNIKYRKKSLKSRAISRIIDKENKILYSLRRQRIKRQKLLMKEIGRG